MNSHANDKYLVKLGKHIKQLREAKGLSYRELASRCSIEYSRLHSIEAGAANIQILTLIDLAAGLDVHPSEILNFQ